MNCKPGDLAVYVGLCEKSVGKIVTVVGPSAFEGAWVISPSIYALDGFTREPSLKSEVWDHVLRPIRDNDGEDETLTWAGKPQCVPA